jgi:hypothetical protein
MNLDQIFNESKKSDIFENLDFMKSGYCYNNEKENINLSIKYREIDLPGLNTKDVIIEQVKSEINISIYRKIIKVLFETELYSVIDFRESDFERRLLTEINRILNDLIGYKNIICSGYIAGILSELVFSRNNTNNSINSFSHLYKIGELLGFYIWVDPYMKYNDTRLLGFNDVYIDTDRFISINDNLSSDSILSFSFDLSLNKTNSKILYLLSDGSDPIVFSEYKKIERDLKLKKILD